MAALHLEYPRLARAAAALVLCLLAACGSGSSSSAGGGNAASVAEQVMGSALLPPDGVVATAQALDASDLPPDASASVDDADLPANAT